MTRIYYHEKQTLFRCGLHCINNILQSKAYSVEEFDQIANQLSEQQVDRTFLNPFKSYCKLGNYDINVLEVALNKKGYQLKWMKNVEDLNNYQEFKGIIVYKQNRSWFQKIYSSGHWLAILKDQQKFINLDSDSTKQIEYTHTDLNTYLKDRFKQGNYCFIIFKDEKQK